MFLIRRPSSSFIARVLAEQSGKALSYEPVGVTRGGLHSSLRRTHYCVQLGYGEDVFLCAVTAMQSWRMYGNGWTEIHPPGAPTEPEVVYATVVRHLGFWSVNPCRVIYAERRDDEVRSEAFAIGTLPEHAERGEERFEVSWRRADDSVWFEIVAFSAPRHWLAVLGTPVVRTLQRRFARKALRLMLAVTREKST